MPKSKHSPEFRAKVSQEYLDGIGSIQFLADKYSIGSVSYTHPSPRDGLLSRMPSSA